MRWSPRKVTSMPFEITNFSIVPQQKNKFVQPVQLHFLQDGHVRTWEAVKSHDSVSILLYHVDRQAFLLVKQFRPPVYMNDNIFLFVGGFLIAIAIERWRLARRIALTIVLAFGSSPRGLQAMVLGAKVRALLDGRYNVAEDDIREISLPSLRHRLLLNFEGEAEEIDPDDIVREILESVTLAVA